MGMRSKPAAQILERDGMCVRARGRSVTRPSHPAAGHIEHGLPDLDMALWQDAHLECDPPGRCDQHDCVQNPRRLAVQIAAIDVELARELRASFLRIKRSRL